MNTLTLTIRLQTGEIYTQAFLESVTGTTFNEWTCGYDRLVGVSYAIEAMEGTITVTPHDMSKNEFAIFALATPEVIDGTTDQS